MKGVQIRKFAVGLYPRRRVDILLGAPMMGGIRVLHWALIDFISTSQLLVIFRTLPLLVSLRIGVENGPVEWGDSEDQNRQDGEAEQEGVVWKTGFGNLKALTIWVYGGPVQGFDLLDAMGANLGANLEYMFVPETHGEQTRLRSFFGQVVGVSDDLIKSVATTCVHLRYLNIRYGIGATQESFRHLARGPFLRALSVTGWVHHPSTGYDDRFALFLKERGKSITFLKIDIVSTDQTLRLIQEFCPELRELNVGCDDVPEDEFVAFLQGSRKLQRMTLPKCYVSCAIRDEAEERNVDLDTVADFPLYIDFREESWMGW
ncbi:hypothetical protein HK104_006784 [Borealophlyctis nickersoniae]|nr:hypothetical protein HK104_006784 [Borealophlyctis nickersoniae]